MSDQVPQEGTVLADRLEKADQYHQQDHSCRHLRNTYYRRDTSVVEEAKDVSQIDETRFNGELANYVSY